MKQDELKRQEEQRKREQLRKQEEKSREIMQDYISKYLANKDEEFIDSISEAINEFFAGKEKATELEPYKVYEGLGGYENEKNLGLYELLNIPIPKGGDEEDWDAFFDEVVDELCRVWDSLGDEIKEKLFDAYALESVNPDLQEDLKKMYKLFKKKGIDTSYSEILYVFSEVIKNKAIKQLDKDLEELDKVLIPIAKGFSIKLGKNITKENVIKETIKKYPDICNEFMMISRLLDKFHFDYEQDEVEELIEKIKEEIEIEKFEQNLGAAPQKKMVENIIEDLESEDEENGMFIRQELSFKKAEEVQNVTMQCPCCEKEFDYQVNVAEEGAYLEAGTTHEIETECPYCGLPIGISLNVPSQPWTCRSCGKKFETKAAAEEHEQTCEGRRREN